MKIPQKEYSRTSGLETLNAKPFYSLACNLLLAFESTAILENSVNQAMGNVKFSEHE